MHGQCARFLRQFPLLLRLSVLLSSRKLRCHGDPKTGPSSRETSLYKSTTINISLSHRSAAYNKDPSSTRSIGHATRCSTSLPLQLQPTIARQRLFSGFVLRPRERRSSFSSFECTVGSAAAGPLPRHVQKRILAVYFIYFCGFGCLLAARPCQESVRAA